MPTEHRDRYFRSAAIILIAIGLLRIASTYTTFSEGIDEPIHLAAGLEMYTRHEYRLHLVNPPLPRLAFALGPWLDGMTLDRLDPVYEHVNRVFQSGRGYLRTLAISRAGNAIFFIIAAIAIWMWARREAGDAAAIATLFFFTTQPVILGWFGLVTHDGPAVAGVAVGILAFLRWLERPTPSRAMWFGVAYGFAIACKFSSLVFIPVACLAILLVRRRWIDWRTLALVPLTAAIVICVVYAPFGLDKLYAGLRDVIKINNDPIPTYLFGRVRTNGWWWYFPATLALKTTLPFLVILIASPRSRVFFESIAAAAAMLLVTLPSHLDIGVRYVLPLFVPLSVAAGVAIAALSTRHAALRVVAALLLCWQVTESARAHPDYFPYFNELAVRDPSRYLVDSNLDWGQDILRLSHVVHQQKIGTMGVALFGNVDLDALHFPPRHRLNAFVPEDGWLAVSDHAYRMEMPRGGWTWLKDRPYRRVGKSIRLYPPAQLR